MLAVSDLKTTFLFGKTWIGKKRMIRAVDGVSFELTKGEVLGVVGESGCGKTTLGRSILRLVEPSSGKIFLNELDILNLKKKELRKMRPKMQIIFQDPYASLNPRMQIRQIIAEPLLLHGFISKNQVDEKVVELLAQVGLESYFMHRYPHEMSGGQRQRIAIARVIGLAPDLIIADEPVSALDMSVRVQILNILNQLQKKMGIAMLFISHDFSVVEQVADRIIVMYKGRIVEEATTDELIQNPLHPYTQLLISSIPGLNRSKQLKEIERSEYNLAKENTNACPFSFRCSDYKILCNTNPKLETKSKNHKIACHFR
jgi:peptide/nickel transport system ATP-binding protein/oligopeptide transport system ATP-binding protein